MGSAQRIYDLLLMDSPLSTKQIKSETELRGKFFTAEYNRSLKYLFDRFMIVAFGEADDGAFPSLCVGATKNLFEDLVLQSRELGSQDALKTLDAFMPKGSEFRNYLDKKLGDAAESIHHPRR